MWSIPGARLAVIVVTGLVSAALLVGFTYRNGQRHIVLNAGDSVSIPTLHWTCLASTFHGRPLFTCTSDNKTVRSVTVWLHQVTVGGIGRPAAMHGGYLFRF
jgi:hypothetical protein